jgi:methyl-accepting chemotaxis protein
MASTTPDSSTPTTSTLRDVLDSRVPPEAFATRHRVLTLVLWLHLPLVVVVALSTGVAGLDDGQHPHGPRAGGHTATVWVSVAVMVVCALVATVVRQGRLASMTVSTGLLVVAAGLVHAGGGLTDLHFHFFVVIALISLYQDWAPFAWSVVLVAVHHLGMGLVDPTGLFSDPRAQENPLPWVVLHAVFILAECAALVAYWAFAASAKRQADAVQAEQDAATRESLRAAADEAAGREREAAARADAELARSEELSAELRTLLERVADTGVELDATTSVQLDELDRGLERISEVARSVGAQSLGARDDTVAVRGAVEDLRTVVLDIQEVAGLIDVIAGQTTLLALNATIEASRAGEAGRGFAVVADEVRGLAGQTATATSTIGGNIEAVEQAITRVAAAVASVEERLDGVAAAQVQVLEAVARQRSVAASARTNVAAAAQQVSAVADVAD